MKSVFARGVPRAFEPVFAAFGLKEVSIFYTIFGLTIDF
jgi:hypothetical protein